MENKIDKKIGRKEERDSDGFSSDSTLRSVSVLISEEEERSLLASPRPGGSSRGNNQVPAAAVSTASRSSNQSMKRNQPSTSESSRVVGLSTKEREKLVALTKIAGPGDLSYPKAYQKRNSANRT